MTTRRDFLSTIPAAAVGGGLLWATQVRAQGPITPSTNEWHSPSLTMETVMAPNGAVTTPTQLKANSLWGLTESKVAEKVVDGVYALRGWGIASSFALNAPAGTPNSVNSLALHLSS